MKVLLLGFGKIAYMPYMQFYLDELKNQENIELDLIYWDRDGKPDAVIPPLIRNAYKYEAHLEEQLPFKRKLKYFLGYRRFALKILKNNKYDKIIVLHTTPGLTLFDYLIRNYKKQYILDFRDISYERIGVYRKLVSMLSKESAITYVSSDAFRKVLPPCKHIFTIHNYQDELLQHRAIGKKFKPGNNALRICYWGLVRHIEINKKVIDAFGNDSRFELHYYGRMQEDGREMKRYATSRKLTNVFFHGQYMPPDRYSFASATALIHNIYNIDHTAANAMGNKYYDGIFFEIPQICSSGSYMGEKAMANKVGICIDADDERISDKIWDYYNGIDWEQFKHNCEKARLEVVEQQEIAKDVFRGFINQ